MKTLYDYIVASAESATALQKSDGSFPAGVNGPHNQPETPVRTTSHWLITLLKAYEISNEQKFLDGAKAAVAYLLLPAHRPHNKTYVCRELPGLDKANGLIGQAWVIEALCKAYAVLKIEPCLQIAHEVFELHPFNEKSGLWEIVDADGSRFRTRYDLVINHQIWFAAAASGLLKLNMPDSHYRSIDNKIRLFLDNLDKNLFFNKNGTYSHSITQRSWLLFTAPVSFLKISPFLRNLKRQIMNVKEELAYGYHAFHTHGLAILNNNFADHLFWDKQIINKGIGLINSQGFKSQVAKSKYGMHYNPPGIECAYSLQAFSSCHEDDYSQNIVDWLRWQFENTWSTADHLMNKVLHDPVTYASRIYEATRLKNYDLF